MLLLTRRVKESIYIYPDDLPPDMTVDELFGGEQIVITLQAIKGNQVQIGIEAPQTIRVLRDDAKEIL